MTHLKLSGMELGKQELIKIAEHSVKCPLLLAIHLNDNDITRDQKYMLSLLEVFNLGEIDLKSIDRIQQSNQKLLSPKGSSRQHSINYKDKMRQYLGFKSPKVEIS